MWKENGGGKQWKISELCGGEDSYGSLKNERTDFLLGLDPKHEV